MKNMYTIVHGNFSDDIKQELESHDSFVTIRNNMDTTELLNIINIIRYNFCSGLVPENTLHMINIPSMS